jgi:hypothetical protein
MIISAFIQVLYASIVDFCRFSHFSKFDISIHTFTINIFKYYTSMRTTMTTATTTTTTTTTTITIMKLYTTR